MDLASTRKIVLFNQASNYLTIGLCNAFCEKFQEVVLITGSVHVQGEILNENVQVIKINHWVERPAQKKFLSYLIAIWKIFWLLKVKHKSHEVLFISLPPMGYLLNLVLKNRFSMLVWDVYPDVFKITGLRENNFLLKFLTFLNRKSFRKAYKIFTIGEKMADLLSNYVSREKLIIQPIWSIFQEDNRPKVIDNPFIEMHQLHNKFVVQYSGNIGLTHKVEVLVDLAERLKEHKDIVFQIIGRGPRVPYLKKIVSERSLPNCVFLPFQSDDMFPYSLAAANLGVVILDELTSKGSVPSKSYNLMSYGIPSLYIAADDSELNDYAKKYNHAHCYSEKNLEMAANFILELSGSKELANALSKNALKASENFKRSNADLFIKKYLE